jgi:hypothetical protein
MVVYPGPYHCATRKPSARRSPPDSKSSDGVPCAKIFVRTLFNRSTIRRSKSRNLTIDGSIAVRLEMPLARRSIVRTGASPNILFFHINNKFHTSGFFLSRKCSLLLRHHHEARITYKAAPRVGYCSTGSCLHSYRVVSTQQAKSFFNDRHFSRRTAGWTPQNVFESASLNGVPHGSADTIPRTTKNEYPCLVPALSRSGRFAPDRPVRERLFAVDNTLRKDFPLAI